jgi:hypothetical protein
VIEELRAASEDDGGRHPGERVELMGQVRLIEVTGGGGNVLRVDRGAPMREA